jgi:hypothetical protein
MTSTEQTSIGAMSTAAIGSEGGDSVTRQGRQSQGDRNRNTCLAA